MKQINETVMIVITPKEYKVFNRFFVWFKERTDTNLASDFVEFLKTEGGMGEVTVVVEIVSKALGLQVQNVLSDNTTREYSDCRRIISVILKGQGFSLKSIGRLLGDRDHSTILVSIRKHTGLMVSDAAYREKFKRASEMILRF